MWIGVVSVGSVNITEGGNAKGDPDLNQIISDFLDFKTLQKNIYFCFIDYTKAFDFGSQHTVENS